jgi:hypothetical protein
MKTRVLFLGLAAALLATASVLAAPEPAWKEFTSRDGGFSVRMPKTPTEQTKSLKSPFGPVDVTMFQAISPKDGLLYQVAYNDFPAFLVQLADADDVLKAIPGGVAQGVNGKVLSNDKVKLGDHPGREFEIEVFGGQGVVHGRAYLVKDRLYQVMVIAPKDAADSPDINRFLDSFKLTKDD